MVSKQEILGNEILKRIHIHNRNDGGVYTLTTGAQGSAKTSVLLSFTDYTILNHSDEKIFWSECYEAPLQIFKLEENKYKFFAFKDLPIKFRDRNNKLEPLNLPVIRFNDFQDLYDKAETGIANVIFFGNRLIWMDFIRFLRNTGEWSHVFIDEFAEVCPAYQSGNMWKNIGLFANSILKDIRKCMINLHTNTQTAIGIDDRIVKQAMINIYLPGAIAIKSRRVKQKAIDNLKSSSKYGNEAYIEYSGKFGVTIFEDIYLPNTDKHIDIICNGIEGEGKYNYFSSFQDSN